MASSRTVYPYLILNLQSLFSDNIPTYLIRSWPLDADLFDGDILAGPVPSIFCKDEDGVAAAITDNLVKFHSDLLKLAKLFMMPESVTISLIKNGVQLPIKTQSDFL